MKLFKIYQDEVTGYDTYDSAVVCTENEEEARSICPDSYYFLHDGEFVWDPDNDGHQLNTNDLCYSWAQKIEDVEVEYLGEAKEGMKKGIIVSSFNAG